MPSARSRILGCLLAGAVGDALGGPIEFVSLRALRRRYGESGLTSYEPAYGLFGAITDDTQMTLFTAEGLLRSEAGRLRDEGTSDLLGAIRRAYLRWLRTQDEESALDIEMDGWLVRQPVLHHQRAPGNTCISALRSGGDGTVDRPINDSKGCGGVMRVAPIGFATPDAFALAAQAAALTHGHPSGYLSAGVLAEIVHGLMGGNGLRDAVVAAATVLRRWPAHEETLAAVEQALRFSDREPVGAETVERLGGGWVGEEALAIGVYCALVAQDMRSGILLAVNHSGDSDSTGAITGNILGAHLGLEAVPGDLLAGLEGRDVITVVAEDLAAVFVDGASPDAGRYPPV
jgi:ADP-ribosylglycohydrolase